MSSSSSTPTTSAIGPCPASLVSASPWTSSTALATVSSSPTPTGTSPSPLPIPSSVAQFYQKASVDFLRSHGAVHTKVIDGVEKELVYLDSGVVFFDAKTTQVLVNIHLYPPLDACTYMGVDSGATPLRIELYSDIMEALGDSPITFEQYLNSPTSSPQYAPRFLLHC